MPFCGSLAHLRDSSLSQLLNATLKPFSSLSISTRSAFWFIFLYKNTLYKSTIIKLPLATARAAYCIGAVYLFVCLSVAKMQKNAIFSKTNQIRAVVSIEVVHGLFKEPITGPLKSKMAEIRHLANRHDVIFFLPRVVRFG